MLSYLHSQDMDDNIPLEVLSLRTAMLLDLVFFGNTPEGVVFWMMALTKQSGPGKAIKDFFALLDSQKIQNYALSSHFGCI